MQPCIECNITTISEFRSLTDPQLAALFFTPADVTRLRSLQIITSTPTPIPPSSSLRLSTRTTSRLDGVGTTATPVRLLAFDIALHFMGHVTPHAFDFSAQHIGAVPHPLPQDVRCPVGAEAKCAFHFFNNSATDVEVLIKTVCGNGLELVQGVVVGRGYARVAGAGGSGRVTQWVFRKEDAKILTGVTYHLIYQQQ